VNDPVERFVGRERELDVVHAAFDLTCSRGSSLVLVEAPAGFGKSTLLRRIEADLVGRATPVRVNGLEDERDLPFSMLAQLRAALAVSVPFVPLHGLELVDPWEAGAELLRLAADHIGGPVVLLVDDLHWGDADSMKAFTFVFRRLGAAPLLAVGTLRPGSSNADPVVRMAQSDGTILRLEGLRAGEIAELGRRCGRTFSTGVAEQLQRTTRGNPLHVRALLDEVDDQDLASDAVPAPREFGLVVEAQLARIDAEPRRLIDGAAILGSGCRLDHAGLVAGIDPALLPMVADVAVAEGVLELVVGSDGLALRFEHPLVLAAVRDRIAPECRLEFHRRAADVLTGLSALDHAVLASLGPDPELATRVIEAAAADATAGAFTSSARRSRQAARLVGDDPTRADLLLDAVEQFLRGGDVANAREALDLTDPQASARRRLYLRGTLAFFEGRVDAAVSDLTTVWTEAERPVEGLLAAQAAEQMTRIMATSGQGAPTARWAQRCLDELDGPPQSWDFVSADAGVAWGNAMAGRVEAAEAAMAVWGAMPSVSSERGPQRRLGRGLVRLLSDRPELAARDLRVVAEASTVVPLRDRTAAMMFLADAELRLGRWDDALRHAEVARSLAIEGDLASVRPMTRAVMGGILAARGEVEEALAILEHSERDEHLDVMTASAWAWAVALAGLGVGDHRAVVQACSSMPVATPGTDGDEPPSHAWPLLLCEALLAYGSVDAAEECLERFVDVTPAAARPLTLAVATKVRAQVADANGDDDAAREAFAAAASVLDGSPVPFERARLAEARGRFHLKAGDRAEAAAHLDEAVRLYDLLGAVRFGDAARLTRDELHGTTTKATSGTLRLTPKEVAVVTLVAVGRSNREISTELFVTVKTVEYHLGNVFAKVGVRSRTELAAWWHAGHPQVRTSSSDRQK